MPHSLCRCLVVSSVCQYENWQMRRKEKEKSCFLLQQLWHLVAVPLMGERTDNYRLQEPGQNHLLSVVSPGQGNAAHCTQYKYKHFSRNAAAGAGSEAPAKRCYSFLTSGYNPNFLSALAVPLPSLFPSSHSFVNNPLH